MSALTLPGRRRVDGGGAAQHSRRHGAATAVIWGRWPGEALSCQLLPLLILHLLQFLTGLHLGLLFALLPQLLPEKEEDNEQEMHQSMQRREAIR